MNINHLKKIFYSSPVFVQKIIRFIYNIDSYIPFTYKFKKRRWLSTYVKFGLEQRKFIFLSIARFLNINRPIPGYYFEFGSFGAQTMRMAWDSFHHLFDLTYVAFDSFAGLPEIAAIDKQEIWKAGKLKVEEDNFRKIVESNGMPKEKLTTVKGFYDQVLTEELKKKFLPRKAAVIYIDCDLYVSTVPVLNFIKDFLQRGTVIVFDDWNCFCGDPSKGERLAFQEFRQKNPQLIFEEFVQTNEARSFIYLGEK